jgi:ABC-type nitrate/sulfonate/bicarbonate transport system substrate-binding protein
MRRPALRRAIPAVALLAALPMVACCSSAKTNTPPATRLHQVTLVLDWTPNTNHSGIYLAKSKGWYRDAGLDVKIVQPGDNGSLQPLAAGRADFAISIAEEVIPARAQGLPVVSLAAIIRHNTSSLLALKSSGITRPRDLQGKTYGGYGGQLERALVSKLVRCDGGDPSKVKFVDVGNTDYRVGLTKHFYDFVWIFDGWDKIRLQQIDRLPVTSIPFAAHTDCIPDWYTPLIATNERLLHNDPGTVRKFMAATARGYREAMTHPDEAANSLLEAAPDLDPQLVRLSARYLATRYAPRPDAWGQQELSTWQRFADFLVQAGLVTKKVAAADTYTNAYLPKATPAG